MIENLKYIDIKDEQYIEFIILLTYESPLKFLKDISEKLNGDKKHGYILIDTLFQSGKSKDRFIELYWNGKSIEKESIKYIYNIKDKYIKLTCDFIRKNEKLLNNSILNEVQKKLILKGANLK